MEGFEIIEDNGERILTSYTGKERRVVVPKGISGIGSLDDDFVFHSNPNIEEVVVPNGVEFIDSNVFYKCENLKSVILPPTLAEINMEAFFGCKNLEKVNLPENLQIVGPDAFKDCPKLKIESVPPTISEIQINSFDDTREILHKNPVYVETGDFMYNTGEKAVLYALGADSDNEEEDEDFLKNAVLPLDAESIAWNALAFGRFESISIPNSLGYIGRGAFMFCENLRKIEIPAGVEVVDSGAFINCRSLESVVFSGKTPLTLGSMAFAGCPKLKSVVLPKGSEYEGAFDDGVEVFER